MFFREGVIDNAFSNVRLQSRLPGASQRHSYFPARSRANAFCHSQLQTWIAGASHQVEKHPRSVNSRTRPHKSGAALNAIYFSQFEAQIELLQQSGAHFVELIDLIFQKCSEPDSFSTFWSANWALATVLCTFSTTFADRGPHPRKQRPYLATLLEKT